MWPTPSKTIVLENPWVRLEAADLERDLDSLYRAASVEYNGTDLFEFHANAPAMTDRNIYADYLAAKLANPKEVVYKVFSKRLNRDVGCVSLMNIQTGHGCVEVGSVWYSLDAQKTEINTNTMLLLFSYVFDELKYRRLEWKCNDRNDDSKRAALRLGFEYEGLFRQHMITRGQNRDTAWYSIIDGEWPDKKAALIKKRDR